MIKVEIVADSINKFGDRLTSLLLTYPRIIHSEMMTHRMFSRNASSSRAVPIKKMIESVKNNTFCPFEFQKTHSGMQGSEYFVGKDKEDCINLWLESAELALQQAEKMKEKGITKQIINRILEPYQYYTVLVTSGKEGWDNFFSLRAPIYETEIGTFKSKNEALLAYSEGGVTANLPETDLDWLKINKGQSEIHMMSLAESIYDSINESTPKLLESGEWHIPMVDKINLDDTILNSLKNNEELDLNLLKVKISTALSARTSYTVIGDNKDLDYTKLLEVHDKCVKLKHNSVLEHCARAMSDKEYKSFAKGNILYNSNFDNVFKIDNESLGWCYNNKGFIQYRYLVENNLPFKN